MRRVDPAMLGELRPRERTTQALGAALEAAAAARSEGEAGLRARVSGDGPLVYDADTLATARDALPTAARDALERAAARIRALAEATCAGIRPLRLPVPGGEAGVRRLPVRRAGCLADRPSDVLATVVPARIAGVHEVWVACRRPGREVLGAAAIAGADAVVAAGGGHAVAALAYGIGPVPRCDAVVGRGDAQARAAKRVVAADVAVDALQTARIVAVLADGGASAALIAADLAAWAEREPDALVGVISPDMALVDRIERSGAQGWACVVGIAAAIHALERLRPDRVALHLRDPDAVAARLSTAGALLLGGATDPSLLDADVLAVVEAVVRGQPWLWVRQPGAVAADASLLAAVDGRPAARRAADLRAGPADTPVRGAALEIE